MRKILWSLLILFSLSLGVVRAEERILNGRILAVNRKFNFVIINLGKEDGIEKGMIFMVYQDKKLLGKVEVEDVFPKMSSCIILPEWKQGSIKVNDGILAE